MIRIFVYLSVFILGIGLSSAQYADSARAVKVIGRAQKDRIVLRWAVTDPVSWQYANKYGYTVERYTILRDGKMLQSPERKLLTPVPLKPAPQAAWVKVMDTNDYAAIAAQSIFGESFQVTPGKPGKKQNASLLDIVNKSTEMEQRFSFALLAADHSYEAATLSGLALTDSVVRKNEKYFYRVYTKIPTKVLRLDTANVYIGLADHAPLAKPTDLTAEFQDRSARLRWPVKFLRGVYVSYVVERSEDKGKTFRKIMDRPFLNTNNTKVDNDYFIKIDSIENNKEYQYRIYGITPFSENGPPSDLVKGMGIDPLQCVTAINKNTVDNKARQILLYWTTECTGPGAVEGYEVQRAPAEDGKYTTLTPSILPANVREFTDRQPGGSNYYRIITRGSHNQKRTSFPVLVQLEDSIPPAAPQNLKVRIDTTGVVRLSWQANTEPDLFGYRVYRSNFENSEFGQVTVSPVTVAVFKDSINLKTLTKKIYYKVAAVDTRFNTSEYSVSVTVVKPDVVPPVPPVFTSVKSLPDGVALTWVASSSTDVQEQLLLRKHTYSTAWTELVRFSKDSVSYIDKIADHRNVYQYKLVAVDESGNRSIASSPVSGKSLDDGSRPVVKGIRVEANRTEKHVRLQWTYSQDRLSRYVIYRAKSNEPMTLYKSVEPDKQGFIDTDLSMNTSYRYRIKATFKDGGESPFSDEVKVDY